MLIILLLTLVILSIVTTLLWRFYWFNKRFFKQSVHFHFKNAGHKPYNLQRDTCFSQHIIQHCAVCDTTIRTNHV